MKKSITLIISFVSYLGVFSQPDSGLDSLRKYSYLLIGASYQPKYVYDVPNLDNLKVESYSTGFFVRTNDSLYLVSAYHVLTTFDVYKGIKTNSKVDFILIRYIDTLGKINFYHMPISEIKKNFPPIMFIKSPDIGYFNVTGKFNDAQIFSFENILFKKPEKIPTKAVEKIVAYGYPSNGIFLYPTPAEYSRKIQPGLYEGYIADSTHYDPVYKKQNIDSLYITTFPINYGGMSGCPVFFHYTWKNEKWIDFAGIQSGKSEIFNCSYIVKKQELLKMLSKKR